MSPRKLSLRVLGAVLVTGVLVAIPVIADAASVRVAIWHMGTLTLDRHTMGDTSISVPSNDGTTTDIKVVRGFDGYAYKFNGTSSRVVVPDHASLDPASKPFSITLHAKFRARPVSGVYNLLSKGGGKTRFYKAVISQKGKAVCSFKGGLRIASVHGASSLADKRWHTIVCAKAGSKISITVDGATTSANVRVGSISNARRLFVGAGASGGSKYRGVMDEVTIRAGS
jgi:hypothetical protein